MISQISTEEEFIMHYDPDEKSMTMEAAECKVTISFSVTPKETSIWHYVCTALAQQSRAPVQLEDTALQ